MSTHITNPSVITFGSQELSLMFDSAEEAIKFLEGQSSNPQWLQQWKIETIMLRNKWQAIAITRSALNITLK